MNAATLDAMYHAEGEGVNERAPNYRDEAGNFYLVRCFACAPEHGRENYALAVARGICAWCGADTQPRRQTLDSPIVIEARAG